MLHFRRILLPSIFFKPSVFSARVHGVLSQKTGFFKVTLWVDTTDVAFLQAFCTLNQTKRRHISVDWILEVHNFVGYYFYLISSRILYFQLGYTAS
jgi:hypothetical protein